MWRQASTAIGIFLLAALASADTALAHDLMASTCTIHAQANRLEIRIKIAAESIWPVVQDKIAPGVIFELERFEEVGRPLLLAFARSMHEVTVDGKTATPQAITAAVVEDNFVFTFVYDTAQGKIARLNETYLTLMPGGYISRAMALDDRDEGIAVKTLGQVDHVFEIPIASMSDPSGVQRRQIARSTASSNTASKPVGAGR